METYAMDLNGQGPAAKGPVVLGKIHTIGIAEHKIAHAPDRLSTLGLGSCVGLILYDAVNKVGGMVHIMLPNAPNNATGYNKSKFADTAVDELIRLLVQGGAMRARLTAKLAGGAHMFSTTCNADFMNVGERNIQECKKKLKEHSIRILAEDTGSTSGRSIEFCCETGQLQVRTVSPKSIRLI